MASEGALHMTRTGGTQTWEVLSTVQQFLLSEYFHEICFLPPSLSPSLPLLERGRNSVMFIFLDS